MNVSEKRARDFVTACKLRLNSGLEMSKEHIGILSLANNSGGIKVFRGIYNEPIGYVVYASLLRESVERIHTYGMFPMYPYEWSEGRITYIVDVVLSAKWRDDAMRAMMEWFFKKRVVAFSRRNEFRMYTRCGRLRRFSKKLPKSTA